MCSQEDGTSELLRPNDVQKVLSEVRVIAQRLRKREAIDSLWTDDLINTAWRRLENAEATFKTVEELLAAFHQRMVWALRNRHRGRDARRKHMRYVHEFLAEDLRLDDLAT